MTAPIMLQHFQSDSRNGILELTVCALRSKILLLTCDVMACATSTQSTQAERQALLRARCWVSRNRSRMRAGRASEEPSLTRWRRKLTKLIQRLLKLAQTLGTWHSKMATKRAEIPHSAVATPKAFMMLSWSFTGVRSFNKKIIEDLERVNVRI